MPCASQTDDEAGGADGSSEQRPPPAKKQKRRGNMEGNEWVAAHGNAWQKFLKEKLKKCECENPRVSHSHRAKALKEDEGEGIAPGEPAGCLVCFAPIDRVVRPSPPPCPPLAQAACLERFVVAHARRAREVSPGTQTPTAVVTLSCPSAAAADAA